ncbi:predicted protein [Nematostella vectensis]|uniref:G-protein coupled receptors family 1 profile domain-containing protein n=1 Tax=Nematostella vectensis TaxID=45351 RepID=A7STC6_NEMVE|nr:predicted protein [Nematostella vectensis]|eukprot:XP_001625123.1 predicted protein [Nematostella vectensis]
MDVSANKSSLCAEQPGGTFIAQAVFLIFILLLTAIGNGMVLITVSVNNRLRSSPANYFIASLAVSDLLVALVSLPLRIDQMLHNHNWCLSLEACALWIWSDMICSGSSVGNLAIISMDRYIALSRPLHYRMQVTSQRAFAGIAFVWVYFSIWACLSFMNWTEFGTQSIFITTECTKSDPVYYTVVLSTAFFLPLLIFIFNYCRIFGIARSQARNIAKSTRSSKLNQVSPESTAAQRSYASRRERNFKAAKTVALVGCCFIICWCPFIIIFIVSLWCVECILDLQKHTGLFMFIKVVFVYILPAINSCLNPGIYALYNREFRQALKETLFKMFGCDYFRKKDSREIPSISLQHTIGRSAEDPNTGTRVGYALNESYANDEEC